MKLISKHNIDIGLFLFFMATFFVVTNSDSTSPLFHTRCLDSGIFQYMGYVITQGKIPYTDLFDHKGLILYFLNAFGILINKQWGVLLLQIINMTLVLLVWYKGLIMVKNQVVRLTIIPISLVCLYHCYSGGNLTEDWSLLFISYPIMRYIRNVELKKSQFENIELIAIGLCMSVVTMIRVNNVAPMLGVLIWSALVAIKNKEYQYLYKSVALIFAGWAIPILICMLYMYVMNGEQGLYDMLFANLLFNISYNIDHAAPPYDMDYVKFIYKILLPVPFIIFFCYKRRSYLFPLLIGYAITLLTMGGIKFHHYLIVFLPVIVYSIGVVKGRYQIILMLLCVLFNIKTFYKQFSPEHFSLSHENTSAKFGELLRSIPEYERNNVWSYNGAFLLKEYINNNFVQCNRLFLPWQMDISDGLKSTECNKLIREHPKYIIFAEYTEDWMNKSSRNSGEEMDRKFMLDNYMVFSSTSFEDGTKVYCYKIKE